MYIGAGTLVLARLENEFTKQTCTEILVNYSRTEILMLR